MLQVAELPPIEPAVVEYRLICDECGEKVCGQLLAGMLRGACGPCLRAVLSFLASRYQFGKRPIQSWLSTCLG